METCSYTAVFPEKAKYKIPADCENNNNTAANVCLYWVLLSHPAYNVVQYLRSAASPFELDSTGGSAMSANCQMQIMIIVKV